MERIQQQLTEIIGLLNELVENTQEIIVDVDPQGLPTMTPTVSARTLSTTSTNTNDFLYRQLSSSSGEGDDRDESHIINIEHGVGEVYIGDNYRLREINDERTGIKLVIERFENNQWVNHYNFNS